VSLLRLDRRGGWLGHEYVAIRAVAGCCAIAASLLVNDVQGQSPTRRVTVLSSAPVVQAKLNNPASLDIEIMPEAEVKIGAKIFFKVSTKKSGYLILVDVDASGKVTQIYPNLHSMTIPYGATENTNLLKSGRDVSIPDPNNAFAHFEYVAEPPPGRGIVLALLSAKPVHVVDLPDVPPDLLGGEEAVNFLYDAACALRIAPHEANTPLADPQWSFAAKLYSIEN
jgi:Domain of unknown function (DUF4384)